MVTFSSLCASAMSAAPGQADQRQEFTLVRDGKPLTTIVVAAEPTVAAAFGAEELQDHVRRITGATLPIVSDNVPVAGPRVLVGRSQATDVLGLPGTPLKPNIRPDTFTFADNLWFCEDRPEASKPALPVPESGAVYRVDPRLAAPGEHLFQPNDLQARRFGATAWNPAISGE